LKNERAAPLPNQQSRNRGIINRKSPNLSDSVCLATARRRIDFFMLAVTILGSGSAGNCALVETPACRLLVDGGLSARQMCSRLEAARVQPADIDALLITHEHIDHAGGLDVFCKKYQTPVYCNALTAEALGRSSPEGRRKDFRLFLTGSEFTVGDITVQTFTVPHDAADPIGFVLHHGRSSLGFCTDLGFATKLVHERLRAAGTVVIETNHDEKLLQADSRRPWPVKQRIMSRHGHLSNTAAAEVLASLTRHGLRRAILGHLSRDCNTPDLALGAVHSRLAADGVTPSDIEVFCASQREISRRFPVSPPDLLTS
jgi:phosphoribosyl 1,2-cyclic phosphodiesterase